MTISIYMGETRCHMTGEVARYVMVAAASEHHLLASLLAVALVLVRVGVSLEPTALLPDDGKPACGTGGLTGTVIVGVRVNSVLRPDVEKALSALVFASEVLNVDDFERLRLSLGKATNS
jgi:hypothetical protein